MPLVISDHADWDGLTRDRDRALALARSGSRMARKTRSCTGATQGLRARPLDIVGYGDEDETDGASDDRRTPGNADMNRFAELLDRPRLRARPQQQAAADDGLFPRTRPIPNAAMRSRR